MPLLSVTHSIDVDETEARSLCDTVADLYAEHMETQTDHVAVALTRVASHELWLGRTSDGDDRLLLLEADVRRGRSRDQRRRFALAVMDDAIERFSLPASNLKVVFTEHDGPDFMGVDRVGGAWEPSEAESGNE